MNLTECHADRLEIAEDGSVTFTLRRPLTSKDGEIGFLTLQRPTLDDMMLQGRQPGDNMDKVGWLVARLAGVSVCDFDSIDAEDAMTLTEVIGGFFDRLPDADDPTGGKRRPGDLLVRHAERIAQTEDGAVLTLRRALATKDGAVSAITLRRPSYKEMKTHRASDLATSVKLIAALSGVGPLHLGKIDALDGLILSEIISGFLGSFPSTGGR